VESGEKVPKAVFLCWANTWETSVCFRAEFVSKEEHCVCHQRLGDLQP